MFAAERLDPPEFGLAEVEEVLRSLVLLGNLVEDIAKEVLH